MNDLDLRIPIYVIRMILHFLRTFLKMIIIRITKIGLLMSSRILEGVLKTRPRHRPRQRFISVPRIVPSLLSSQGKALNFYSLFNICPYAILDIHPCKVPMNRWFYLPG